MPALSSDEKEESALGEALAVALTEQMIATYSCQGHLGGLNQYRIAKLDAIETYVRGTGDRNKAVLTIDKIEQQLKESDSQQRLDKSFDEIGLSELNRIGTCQDLVAESNDKVQVLKAKLGLL